MQYLISNKILSGTVAFHDCGHHILRNVVVIGKKLFGVLRQAVAAVAKGRIIVMSSDPGIQADSIDNIAGIQPLHFRVSVQFIKIGNTKCQIGVGKKFYSFCFRISHEQGVNIFFKSTLLKKCCKSMSCLSGVLITGDNDPAWVKIVVQGLGLSEKFRAENNIVIVKLLSDRFCVAYRNRRFDHNCGSRIHPCDQA